MKTKLLVLLFLAVSSLFAKTHVAIGIGIGYPAYDYGYYLPPPPPPPVVAYVPAYPGPEYTWVPGYWYPAGPRYYWRAGYWSRPPFARAYWAAPRYYGHRYYRGHWRRR
jgi:hypothetical protein